MSTKEEIFVKIKQVLMDTFGIEENLITPETRLFDDLDLDSFDAVDLAVMLEVDTGIKLGEEDIRSVQTIFDVVDTIHTKISTVNEIEE